MCSVNELIISATLGSRNWVDINIRGESNWAFMGWSEASQVRKQALIHTRSHFSHDSPKWTLHQSHLELPWTMPSWLSWLGLCHSLCLAYSSLFPHMPLWPHTENLLVSKAQHPWEVLSDYPKNTEAPTEAIYSVEKTEPVSWCLSIHEQRNRRAVRLITTHFCFPGSHAILPEKARLILALQLLLENREAPME